MHIIILLGLGFAAGYLVGAKKISAIISYVRSLKKNAS